MYASGNLLMVGSSPHTRGAQLSRLSVEKADGIIPAYAGSTNGPSANQSHSRDHPRIRGEHPRIYS